MDPLSSDKIRHYTLGVIAHLLVLLAWYLFVHLGDVPRFVMPSPDDTIRALFVADYGWWANIGVTATEIFGGYALALSVGVVLALVTYFPEKHEVSNSRMSALSCLTARMRSSRVW